MRKSNQQIRCAQIPILTVILYTYNHKAFIGRCIRSLLNQKTRYPYKIHIWDDCSTDGTSNICRKFADKYPDKIKLVVQPKNTFCERDYKRIQSYDAMKEINTKYFCAIDGDDYWTDKNKIQMALDFLENHDEYVGWAHDTLVSNTTADTHISHVHDGEKWNCNETKITFSEKSPFLLTSSRIFRNCGYIQENDCLPIDYLVYYYHLSKGPIYYHDQIMAVYNIGPQSTFASVDSRDMNSMFAYKLSRLFHFSQDSFCTAMQHKYDVFYTGLGNKRYKRLLLFKKIFGVKWGWHFWFFVTFVPKYGLKCRSVNYVYNMAKARERVTNIYKNIRILLEKYKRKIRVLRKLQSFSVIRNSFLNEPISLSLNRNQHKVAKLKKILDGTIKKWEDEE